MATIDISSARNRAKSASDNGDGKICPDCVKTGLAIIPVTYTAIPVSIRPGPSEPLMVASTSSEVTEGLRALDRGFLGGDVGQHWYVLRSLPPGYLYVLKSDNSWDGYEINKAGLLRRVGTSLLPSEPASERNCSRSEHNALALQAIVVDPKKDPKIWLAYSRYRWTDRVLARYQKNEEGCRDKRMFALDVAVAASTAVLGAGSDIPRAVQMPSDLKGMVADYSLGSVQSEINKWLLEPLYSRGAVNSIVMVPSLAASPLKTSVDVISAGVDRKTGIVLVLDDAVGMTAQINYSRNRISALAADAAGLIDDIRARERAIAEVIEGIRVNAEANPGPFWNKNYGPERYLRHVDENRWRGALAQSEGFKRYLAQTKLVSKDYIHWKESVAWNVQQRFDFDAQDDTSSLDHERMVVLCVSGSGVNDEERVKVWESVLGLSDTDPDNWLSRALAACDLALQGFMEAAPPTDKDKLDSVGLAKSMASEFLVGGDGRMRAIEAINKLRVGIRLHRAANQATASLIETATGVMGRLQVSNPNQYSSLLRKITKSGLTRDDIIPQPVVVRGTWARISQWIMEVSTGPVRVNAAAAVTMGPMMTGTEYMRTHGNLRQEGWALSQAIGGAVLFSEPGTTDEVAEVAFWIIRKVKSGVALDAVALRRFGLSTVDISIPSTSVPDNPALQSHMGRMAAHADFMVSAAVLLFQANTIWGALRDFVDGKNRGENGVKLLAASLAASSAGLELRVVVQTLVVGTSARELVPVGMLAARLGLAAGVIDGAYTIWQGIAKIPSRDLDSAFWSIGSGLAAVAGSVAVYGFTVSALAALSGGAASATVLGITLGPVGWILLVVAAVGAAIYMGIQAFGTDDTELSPVEYWLDNGVFGKKKRISGESLKKNPFANQARSGVESFRDLQDEIYQLQRVTMVAVADFSRLSSGSAALGMYEIALPRYAKGSELLVVLYGFTSDGKRLVVSQFTLRNGEDTARNFKREIRLTGGEGQPEVKKDDTGVVVITGRLGSGKGATVGLMNTLGRWFGDTAGAYTEVVGFGMELFYYPDKEGLPALLTKLRFPVKE